LQDIFHTLILVYVCFVINHCANDDKDLYLYNRRQRQMQPCFFCLFAFCYYFLMMPDAIGARCQENGDIISTRNTVLLQRHFGDTSRARVWYKSAVLYSREYLVLVLVPGTVEREREREKKKRIVLVLNIILQKHPLNNICI
jgi:hypothetical protein